MALLDWVTASEEIKLNSLESPAGIRNQLQAHKARGFISDFYFAPVVAEGAAEKIVIARKSSFWGRAGQLRGVIKIAKTTGGTEIAARIWYPPIMTVWFFLAYGAAVWLLVLAAWESIRSSGLGNRMAPLVAAIIMGTVWVVAVAVFNAFSRVVRRAAIQELVALIQGLGSKS